MRAGLGKEPSYGCPLTAKRNVVPELFLTSF